MRNITSRTVEIINSSITIRDYDDIYTFGFMSDINTKLCQITCIGNIPDGSAEILNFDPVWMVAGYVTQTQRKNDINHEIEMVFTHTDKDDSHDIMGDAIKLLGQIHKTFSRNISDYEINFQGYEVVAKFGWTLTSDDQNLGEI